MILWRNQKRLVSTWRFFVLYAWTSVSPHGVTAQNITSSSSSYPECSGYVPYIGDSVCDELNNNGGCGYDGGDCCSCTCVDTPIKLCGGDADFNCTDPNVPDDCGETPSPAAAFGFPNCAGYMWYLGNEICNDDLNNEECGYDGGDCCRCTCRSTDYGDSCGYYGYNCLDPDAPTDCESASPTLSPATALGYPDCTGDISDLQNGYCDWDLNNEECGYDGGDCCRCTCEDGIYYTCGYYGYDCFDPTADTDCPTPSPTLSPAAGLGFPDCTGYMYGLKNGFCDSDLNNEECGYDGGDCCSCTCEDGTYECGLNDFDCKDPAAPSYCPASRSYSDCTGDMSHLQNGYCDGDLNNEDCGYDGGDCCECSCSGSYGDDDCGENGYYSCLDPDPCHDAEKSSEGTIPVGAIIFITSLCAVCAVCFVIWCPIIKRHARTATSSATIPSAPLSPVRTQHWVPNTLTNNRAAQQPTITQPVGSAGPSHQVYAVNPQSAAAQSGQQPRAVMPWGRRAPPGQSYPVAGLRAYPQSSVPPAPPQPDSADPRTHGVTSTRVTTFRSAPLPESNVSERLTNTFNVDHRPNADPIEAEQLLLAVTRSRRVQTISEAVFREKRCLPQSDVSTASVMGTGNSPSDIINGGSVEERDPSNADKKYNIQDASSGSEWGSDGEGRVEEAGLQDVDELGAEGHQQTGIGRLTRETVTSCLGESSSYESQPGAEDG